MASSNNRFDVLAQAESSSKEQETESTGRIRGEIPQAGPSAKEGAFSMDGLQGSLPQVVTIHEQVALFKKRGAEMAADKEEKKKRLQQGNSAMIVGRPTPSTAPSQGRPKRKNPYDGAEESSKRQHVGPLPPSRSGEPASAAPTTVSGSMTEEPNLDRLPSTPTLLAPEAGILCMPIPFWTNIRSPRKPLLCIIQVNYSSRVGSFAEDTKSWAFELDFDAIHGRIATMNMNIFANGITGPQCGRTGWCLGDYIEGDWMVTDWKIHHVADCARDKRIGHAKILAACKTDEERARLICISLNAWPKILGHFSGYAQCRNPDPGVKELHSAVFNGRHPYHMFIWFIAPNDLEKFEEQCLSMFTRNFEQRKLPLS